MKKKKEKMREREGRREREKGKIATYNLDVQMQTTNQGETFDVETSTRAAHEFGFPLKNASTLIFYKWPLALVSVIHGYTQIQK